MTRLRTFVRRLWALLCSRQLDRELGDEIASHLAEAEAEYVRQGLSPDEARRAARRSFGGVPQVTEIYRQARSFVWLEEWPRDLRYALRTLRKSPAFAATAAATLAMAIGASTVMFGVVNAVLLRPLPYASPEQLAMLWTEDPAQNLREGRSSLWTVEEWRNQNRSFADMATFDSVSTTLTGADGAEQIAGASISSNLLPLLGVRLVLGRALSAEDAGQPQGAVLISHRFWRARFGESADAIGATLVLNGVPRHIIGILPADFQLAGLDADVWQAHASLESVRGPDTWFVVARLRPGVTVNQAQAEMNAVARRLNVQLPAAQRTRGITVVPLSLYVVGPQSRLAVWMLAGAVLCVFFVAVANVTSLSVARSVARAREMAVRAALGASAGRILRQLLTEGVVLAVGSGLIGTLLALAGIRLVRAFGPANLPGLNDIGLDLPAVGWAFVTSVLAGLLIALAPAIAAVRRDLHASREDGGRRVPGGAGTRRIRRSLVVAELALAIVLLVGAGLLVRSWLSVTSVDPGFRPERVLVMELSAPPAFGTPAQRTDLYSRALEQIQAVPGVEHAGIVGDFFIANSRERLVTIERDDATVSESLRFAGVEVSTDFFAAIGTPLLQGRFFSIADGPDALPVAIVNEAMARRWPGHDPVGRRFKLGPRDSDRPWYTVVGVVADMRRQGLERESFPQMFVPLAQDPPGNVDFFIRTSSDDPLAMAGALRAAVRRVERNAPIYGVEPLEQQLAARLAQRRAQTSLLTGFSVLALLMAAVGIYGLIQYSIATRIREIGVRMAIGARPADIFRLIVGEGLTLSAIGLALGLAGAWALGRVVSGLLFGVTATDPLTFTAVSLVLIVVALAACYVPARRATKVDPITALRAT